MKNDLKKKIEKNNNLKKINITNIYKKILKLEKKCAFRESSTQLI
jgi:hypothetical protein